MPRSRRGAHKRNGRKWLCACGKYVKYGHEGTVKIDNTGKRWCRPAGTGGEVCGEIVNASRGAATA